MHILQAETNFLKGVLVSFLAKHPDVKGSVTQHEGRVGSKLGSIPYLKLHFRYPYDASKHRGRFIHVEKNTARLDQLTETEVHVFQSFVRDLVKLTTSLEYCETYVRHGRHVFVFCSSKQSVSARQ